MTIGDVQLLVRNPVLPPQLSLTKLVVLLLLLLQLLAVLLLVLLVLILQ